MLVFPGLGGAACLGGPARQDGLCWSSAQTDPDPDSTKSPPGVTKLPPHTAGPGPCLGVAAGGQRTCERHAEGSQLLAALPGGRSWASLPGTERAWARGGREPAASVGTGLALTSGACSTGAPWMPTLHSLAGLCFRVQNPGKSQFPKRFPGRRNRSCAELPSPLPKSIPTPPRRLLRSWEAPSEPLPQPACHSSTQRNFSACQAAFRHGAGAQRARPMRQAPRQPRASPARLRNRTRRGGAGEGARRAVPRGLSRTRC